MKNYIAPCILILCLCLASCSSRSGQLTEIDRYMETDPVRALEELEKVRPGELSQSDYPYYALLYTQAQVKNNIDLTSDSLMRHAYEAYRNSADKDLRKRAHFYNAQVAYYAGNLRPAMADAVVAYDISKTDGDPYWIAKTAELMSDIFFDVFNYPQSEMYENECIYNYDIAGRTANHRYALADLATIYLREGKNQQAIAVLDSLFNVIRTEEPFDSALYDYTIVPMCSALFVTNQLDSLEKIIPERYNLTGNDAEFDHAIANSYLLDESESRQLLWEAYNLCPDDKYRARILYTAYQQALSAGNYRRAAELTDSLLDYQGRIATEVVNESVTGAQRDYYLSKSRFEAQKSKIRLYGLIAVAVVAVIILISLVSAYRLKMRARKAELEANLSALMSMKAQVASSDSEKERLNASLSEKSLTIENLFKEKWSTLNMLCNEYFELGDSKNTRDALLSRIENELNKLRSKKSLKDIEAAVDANMGNLMSMLREECLFISEDDFVFLSLVFAGFSTRAVCLFTDIKYKQFYMKKYRLTKRIATSEATHKDLFIEKLK